MRGEKTEYITMKKILSCAVALVLLCASLSSCGKNDGVPDGMILASGDAADYYMYIPEDWTVDLQTGATTAHVSSSDRSNVGACSWLLEYTDDTVDTWHERQLEDLTAGFSDYNEESVTETEIDGVYAKEYVFTARLANEERKYRQTAAVKGGSVYVITYSTTPELFEEHSGEAYKIVEEFCFR